ncbi:MAG: hypothetical protein HY736_26050 [Verrucomicrobia bacterium]|nr:hypothetical protein [Verrucomicrobiota bacterium]
MVGVGKRRPYISTASLRLSRVLLRFAAAFLFALAPVHAAPPVAGAAKRLERDLGQGLAYHRIHELPRDLPAIQAPRPCVVDVRYVSADPGAATAFLAWLTFHASPRTPVFVLANADTGGALLASFGARDSRPGFVVVGIASRNFHPDLAVRASAEDERRAYDAFEAGVAIAVLLTDHPDKIRNDEASLAADRLADSAAQAVAKDGPPPPPIDATLQRAVHVHRALLALKKI